MSRAGRRRDRCRVGSWQPGAIQRLHVDGSQVLSEATKYTCHSVHKLFLKIGPNKEYG